jgi:hypothetical protein
MWKRSSHLLSGLFLLMVAGYFMLWTVHEWKALWRREVSATVHQIETPTGDANEDDNAVTEAARLRLYGVLAPTGSEASAGKDARTPRRRAPTGADRANPAPAQVPRHFLHGRFSVRSYQGFVIDVPAHTTRPRVYGRFRAFAKGDESVSATLDVLLLSRQEFTAFVRRGLGATVFSMQDSAGGSIDWVLDPTFLNSQRYYMVFNNSSGRPAVKRVEADFTVSFE